MDILIDAEHFRYRFQHAWNKINWHVPDELKKGRFVDIGCGIGNGVAAAISHGASASLGIDDQLTLFPGWSLEEFRKNCAGMEISTKRSLLLEADIFNLNFFEQFEYALMLDSVEHVPGPRKFFDWAYRSLTPGGAFVVDTCPLFNSPVGSHLWDYFPAATDPWAHLKPDFESRCGDVHPWHLGEYKKLNKITHQEIRDAFEASGFEITLEHRSVETPEMTALFDKHGHDIDLTKIERRTLFEDWLLLVGRK